MPADRMSKFEIFIGTWNTTGEVLATDANPAGILVATDTYRWLPGRHFIVHEVDARFDGQPSRSMEVMGLDPASGKLLSTSYDDQGQSESFVLSLDKRRFAIQGNTTRFNGAFDASRGRLEGAWERKASRSRWRPWITLVLVRA